MYVYVWMCVNGTADVGRDERRQESKMKNEYWDRVCVYTNMCVWMLIDAFQSSNNQSTPRAIVIV